MVAERVIRSIISPQEEGLRLDLWLSSRFNYLSRNQWQEEIKHGRVKLNDRNCRCSRILHQGEVVAFYPEQQEPPVDFDYRIVYEDCDLLVVDKGGWLPCHPAGAYFRNTLWYDLTEKFGEVAIINRLDRETSGLLIASRNRQATAALSAQLQNNEMKKTYHALVFGEFNRNLNATGYLSDDPESAVRKKRRFTLEKTVDDAESAVTLFEPVRYHDGISLVKACPETGRLHQIRATLCSLGYPMVGDKIYGPDENCYLRFIDDTLTQEDLNLLRMGRQALHASALEFKHPATGENLHFESPLPKDFIELKIEN